MKLGMHGGLGYWYQLHVIRSGFALFERHFKVNMACVRILAW